jgi:hypothetical protein
MLRVIRDKYFNFLFWTKKDSASTQKVISFSIFHQGNDAGEQEDPGWQVQIL